ncbi:unnamed protein product [Nezara viridula]|uniref:Uncharacterized protein n=1 Tax=Nezara viridula TaxID=85310 RepID=A0A9P0HQT4_NEZVI|nr:unnamed protein product [Nezara viridula]
MTSLHIIHYLNTMTFYIVSFFFSLLAETHLILKENSCIFYYFIFQKSIIIIFPTVHSLKCSIIVLSVFFFFTIISCIFSINLILSQILYVSTLYSWRLWTRRQYPAESVEFSEKWRMGMKVAERRRPEPRLTLSPVTPFLRSLPLRSKVTPRECALEVQKERRRLGSRIRSCAVIGRRN